MRRLPPNSPACALRGLLLAGLLVTSTGVAGTIPQRRADFRADVELVRLNVAVVNPSGGEVPPLSEEDFTVYEDGVPQRVELFLRPSDTPLQVALVLDSSTSMRPVAGSTRRAALTFLSQLDAEDCVMVLPFSDRVGPGRRARAADPGLRLFVDQVVAGGGTALYDALLRGLQELERGSPVASGAESSEVGTSDPAGAGRILQDGSPPSPGPGPQPSSLGHELARVAGDLTAGDLEAGATAIAGSCPGSDGSGTGASERRKAIVLLSDGADENSAATFDDVLLAARQASVPVFPVAFGYAHQDPRLEARLAELARATGGRRLRSATPAQLRGAYAEAVDYLKSSYVLGYHPGPKLQTDPGEPPGGGPGGLVWHDVRVELRRPLLEAIVRPGYYR